MKNLDISTTPLSSLFASLSSLADNNAKSAAGRKAKEPKKAPIPLDKRPIVFRAQWTHQAVVMHITRNTCACCGHCYSTPSDILLLRRTNETLGTHMKAMAPGEAYHDLPHETVEKYAEVPACHLCFPFVEAIERMEATKQIPLPLFNPASDPYLNPPPPPEGRPRFTKFRLTSFTPYKPVEPPHHRTSHPELYVHLNTRKA